MNDLDLLPILTKACQDIIAKADAEKLKDVYVVFIYVEDENDRMPELCLGWNTNATWKACCPRPGQESRWPIASSAGEAKWNFAFWEDDEGTPLMTYFGKEQGNQLKVDWMRANDFYVDKDLRDSDFDAYLRTLQKCSDALWQLGADLALQLRKETFFTDVFGHRIPILVLECHMDDRMNEYVKMANPDGQAEDLDSWTAIDPYTGEIYKH
jgi:hypothetical protein